MFDYMIDLGLSHGYVNSGKTFIFFFIRPEDPQTLFYETVILKDPIEDPSTISSILPFEQLPDEQLRLTAVGLVAGFTQMALSQEPWDEEYRTKARNKLSTWQSDDGKYLDGMSPEENTNEDSEDFPDFEEPDDLAR